MSGLELIAAGIGALSAAASGAAAIGQAIGARQTAKYNKKVAQRNEKIALSQASKEAEEKRRQNARQLGAIRATYGSSGLDLAGSPLDIMEDQALENAFDVEKIYYKGRLRAMGYQDQAAQFDADADNASSAVARGTVATIFNVGGSFAGSDAAASMF